MPKHNSYLEPYFGSGAVLFNKPPSKIETINDLDGNVVNLFRVLRDNPEELARMIDMTPWSRQEYYESYEPTDDLIEQARRFLIRSWQAQYSQLNSDSGWRNAKRKGGSDIHSWRRNLPDRILATASRLKEAQIENIPALEIISQYKDLQTLIYADPPYVLDSRSGKMYAHEMTNADHIELLEVLDAHPGPVILSGYACSLYDERLSHWTRRESRAQAEKGNIRTEVLWINPIAAKSLQMRLFD